MVTTYEAYLHLYRARWAAENKKPIAGAETPWAITQWENKSEVERRYIMSLQRAGLERMGVDVDVLLADFEQPTDVSDVPDTQVVAW